MLRNYLLIAYRNILKSKLFSFVNIFGLGIGMAAFLFIIHYVRFERSYENFLPHADNIYRITYDIYKGSEYVVTDCETHAPMGPMLKEKMPEVVDFVRFFGLDNHQFIQVGDQKFLEGEMYFTDQSVFKIFSLQVLHGKAQNALTAPFQAVLTESHARKYFGRTNVAGEPININKQNYQITAVIADPPANTHLPYTVLLSHPTLLPTRPWYNEQGWNGNNEYTYLLMQPGTNLATFNKKLLDVSLSLKDKLGGSRYTAEPIRDIHLYSNKTYEPSANGSAKVVKFLLIVAGFIILIAWVNYINLSTARAVERAREVGIRKVMGSVRKQLIFQFLSESVLVNALAALLAVSLFQIALPLFRELTGQPLPLRVTADPVFWYLFAGLYISGVLLSGIYPAFVLSSFRPATVLKGKFKSSVHGQYLRKALVVFQFAATVVLIVGMSTVYLQVNHLRTYDLGMNIDQTVVIRAPLRTNDSVFTSAYQSFKNELLNHTNIQGVSRSESFPGSSLVEVNTTSFTRVGQENQENGGYEYYFYSVDADFIKTMGMKLVAGINFEDGAENHDRIIINEEAVQRLGFADAQEAIGQRVTFRTRWPGEPSTIIGVIKNFYHRSPKEDHLPMVFDYVDYPDYFAVRLKSGDTHQAIASIKTTWDQVFPENVFDYFFLDEQYEQQFKSDMRFGSVMATFSGLAVLIACLGLFGLSSYTIVQRTKEIGIRKVLGASVAQIVQLLTSDFVRVVFIASLIGLPIAYVAMEDWLSNYSVRINLNVLMFIVPVATILFIALVTVSFQTIQTALENPSKALKQE
ncbi:ABC transporter permease [Chryseosolibacter indicus]|uniref:ABC transporter permease n=1 Tax=Chryseosolibacter indicus TaxID=2782351 RepID=A0ABS5VQ10_9BACT|nr:ABC transporter permease [Chryseosolibacter indicus]MBT1703540.1 ABC transporter permease [Chryseosolibacter indicus]